MRRACCRYRYPLPQEDHQPGQPARDGRQRDGGRSAILGLSGMGVLFGRGEIDNLLNGRIEKLRREDDQTQRDDQRPLPRGEVEPEGEAGRE